jgi:hypothetical protein
MSVFKMKGQSHISHDEKVLRNSHSYSLTLQFHQDLQSIDLSALSPSMIPSALPFFPMSLVSRVHSYIVEIITSSLLKPKFLEVA